MFVLNPGLRLWWAVPVPGNFEHSTVRGFVASRAFSFVAVAQEGHAKDAYAYGMAEFHKVARRHQLILQ